MKGKFLLLFLFLIFLGLFLRILLAFCGHNFDMDSYFIVGEIVSRGGNVYLETSRYNYGPIWSYILGGIYSFAKLFSDPFFTFRLFITIFLTFIDLAIFFLLLKKFGKKIAFLFFLNPISIIITGYHSQFDNFAILLGLYSVLIFQRSFKNTFTRTNIFSLIVLGLSLSVKHILFLFPFWLALKQNKIKNKIFAFILPIFVFLILFVPFWEVGHEGIINNVFFYQSFSNKPFWYLFAPEFINNYIPPFLLFLGTLILLGFYFRKRSLTQTFFYYLGSVVIFSSAIANQYLAITVPFLAVNFNFLFFIFTLVATIHLLIDLAGLNISFLKSIIPPKIVSYNVQIFILFFGFVYLFLKKEIKTIFLKILKATKNEWKNFIS